MYLIYVKNKLFVDNTHCLKQMLFLFMQLYVDSHFSHSRSNVFLFFFYLAMGK